MAKKRKPQAKPWEPFQSHPSEVGGGTIVHFNNHYTVHATPISTAGLAGMMHLSIRRTHDRKAIHDWRHFQRIKNEICGVEREAIEIYPAESRLVDEANQFHLWVFGEGVSIPVGFDERMVGSAALAAEGGSVQRDFDIDDPNYADSQIPIEQTHIKIRGGKSE